MDEKERKQAARKERMLTDPIPQIVCRMAIPSIISFLITSVYNLADTYFVSTLGTDATAAVTVNASLDQIIFMAGSMLAVGANSYIARLLGEKNEKKASQVLSTAWGAAFFFGLLVTILGFTFMKPLVRLLGAQPSSEQYSIQYATYVLMVAPLMSTSFVMNQCLRAEGSAMLSMVGMGFGGILNCFLDPIFIFRMGLGVAGASMATAISKLISFGILIFPYLSGRSVLRLGRKYMLFSRDIITQVASVGSSSMFRNGLNVISSMVLNNLAGTISVSVQAGIGVTNKVMMFPFGIILGFGAGYQPVAGFSWGAKRYDRARACYHFAAKTAVIGCIIMGSLVAIFADPIIGFFTETDPEMLRLGALCIRLQCLALPVHGWVAMVNMFCAGLGYAGGAACLATARQGSCFFPIVWPLARLLKDIGLCAVQAAADILSLFLAIPVLRHAMKMIREAEAESAEKIYLLEGGQ